MLVVLALFCLQFDRATAAPSPLASITDSIVLDGGDETGDDLPSLDGDRTLTVRPAHVLSALSPSTRLPLSDRTIKQAIIHACNARGPPAHI